MSFAEEQNKSWDLSGSQFSITTQPEGPVNSININIRDTPVVQRSCLHSQQQFPHLIKYMEILEGLYTMLHYVCCQFMPDKND